MVKVRRSIVHERREPRVRGARWLRPQAHPRTRARATPTTGRVIIELDCPVGTPSFFREPKGLVQRLEGPRGAAEDEERAGGGCHGMLFGPQRLPQAQPGARHGALAHRRNDALAAVQAGGAFKARHIGGAVRACDPQPLARQQRVPSLPRRRCGVRQLARCSAKDA